MTVFFPFFFDPTMIIVIPAAIFALWSQMRVRSAFGEWSRIRSSRGIPGRRLARQILDDAGLQGVEIEPVKGSLTDHYDPRGSVLRLSEEVYGSESVAALGVAAHEAGHAIQHSNGYFPLFLRSSIAPVASFGSMLAFPLFFIGLFFVRSPLLMNIGLLLFAGAVLFHMVTLPVEFNASSRALGLLDRGGYLHGEELEGARKVLRAAGWTYVAAAATAVLTLVRLLILRGYGDD